jgi:hypothetical protein
MARKSYNSTRHDDVRLVLYMHSWCLIVVAHWHKQSARRHYSDSEPASLCSLLNAEYLTETQHIPIL